MQACCRTGVIQLRVLQPVADRPGRAVGLVLQDPEDQLFAGTVADDLAFGPQAVLLMTEKDAVKCAALPLSEAVAEAWVLPVTAQLPPALMDLIVEKLRGCSSA